MMHRATDPLAGFRTRDARAPLPAHTPAPSYRAFGTAAGSTKPVRLDVRVKGGMSVARLYSSIQEIAYDRDSYSGILLVVAGKVIKIRGRGLQPVVEALLTGTCEFIAERKEGESFDEHAPVIDRIETLAPEKAA